MALFKKKKKSKVALDGTDVPETPEEQRAPSAIPRAVAILLGLAGLTITIFGLAAIQSIASPVILALILTICVHPIRVAMERRGISRGIATGTVALAVFGILAAFIAALIISLAQFAALLPQFKPQMQAAAKNVGDWLSSLGVSQKEIQSVVSGFNPANLLGFINGLLGSVTSITFALVVILTCLILMAQDASFIPTLFNQLRPKRPLMVGALESYAHNVRRYMVTTTWLGIVQGVLNAIFLVIIGVPGAWLWGMLAFLCSFIPNVGYFIAIIPPLFFGFLVGGWPAVIAVVIVYGLINAVVQSIIQPRVVGNAVALSQTITFVSVLVWAVVLGPIGAILAIPLTLLIRTVLIDADRKQFWWRPVLGDFTETKALMQHEDEDKKAAKVAKKATKSGKTTVTITVDDGSADK